MKGFSLFTKKFYRIAWSVEKNTESKKTEKRENNAFIKMYSKMYLKILLVGPLLF